MKGCTKRAILWAKQYSKRILSFVLIGWVVGGVIGVVYEFIRLALCPEIASMDGLYIYLATPLTCGIPSYIIPNMFLNGKKVEQGYIQDYDQRLEENLPEDTYDPSGGNLYDKEI